MLETFSSKEHELGRKTSLKRFKNSEVMQSMMLGHKEIKL